MEKKNSITARILAAAALLAAIVVVLLAVNFETGDDDSPAGRKTANGKTGGGSGTTGPKQQQTAKLKVYVVEEGDTLTVIARKNGVSVAAIERLNPDVDAQALIPGQELKLR